MSFGRFACRAWGAFLLLALFSSPALAQGPGAAAPSPWQARFDVAAGLGWFNGRPDEGYERWYNESLWFGAEGGFFLTENVKLEVGASAATEGRSWSTETPLDSAGQPLSYITSQHEHRISTFSAGVTYQFGRNAWVHPYLGAGVDIDRDRVRTSSWEQPVYPRAGYQSPRQLPDGETTETVARPYGVAGVKVFFSQRVFFRTDLKAAGASGLDKVIIRAMVGADF